MTPHHKPQSRAAVEAEAHRWYGDKPARPGKCLDPKDLTASELDRVRLRVRETRVVANLGSETVNAQEPLLSLVVRFVHVVDNINVAIEYDLPSGAGGIGDGPDFGGLTMDQRQAKRATLCHGARKALAAWRDCRPVTAARHLDEALAELERKDVD